MACAPATIKERMDFKMSTIFCSRVSDDVWEVFCQGCMGSIGLHDSEFVLWCLHERQPVFCFDCDPHADESIGDFSLAPEELWEQKERDGNV